VTIIKHPNGKYSIWSVIVDDFTVINITKEEYIIMKLEDYTKEIEMEFEKVDKDNNYGILYTIDERLNIIEKVHGKERKEEVLKLLNEE